MSSEELSRSLLSSLAEARPTGRPAGMADGRIGLAVALAELAAAEPNAGWDRHAHAHVRAAVEHPPAGPSLFGGLAGLSFALRLLSRDGTRYRTALRDVDRLLGERLELALPGSAPPHRYDLISGLTGVAAAWLDRTGSQLRQRLLTSVVAWSRAPIAEPVDLGMAHGVAGPLALLALAADRPPGAAAAAAALAGRIRAGVVADCFGSDVDHQLPVSRVRLSPGWCYGGAGAARALQLAGNAFAVPEWQALALDLARSAARRPGRPDWEWTLCHGRAGLLHLLDRIHRDLPEPDPLLGRRIARLRTEITTRFTANPGTATGFLRGTAGVGLVLHGLAPAVPQRWARLLLTG
ncbi:lanthionine synthetase LanC family protein [Amycolatopsis sp. NPDC004169]|uniref:lanthionine synthetase LanC family protein n=1 Tax=Amycolatopsis sp. NPDC004169 TaxID=3154453 RepID=UPI0033B7B9CE